jgi:hypothetical protein
VIVIIPPPSIESIRNDGHLLRRDRHARHRSRIPGAAHGHSRASRRLSIKMTISTQRTLSGIFFFLIFFFFFFPPPPPCPPLCRMTGRSLLALLASCALASAQTLPDCQPPQFLVPHFSPCDASTLIATHSHAREVYFSYSSKCNDSSRSGPLPRPVLGMECNSTVCPAGTRLDYTFPQGFVFPFFHGSFFFFFFSLLRHQVFHCSADAFRFATALQPPPAATWVRVRSRARGAPTTSLASAGAPSPPTGACRWLRLSGTFFCNFNFFFFFFFFHSTSWSHA